MKKNAGPRIPSFTRLETELVKGSFDFLGINFYQGAKVADDSHSLDMAVRDYFADGAAELKGTRLTFSMLVVQSILQSNDLTTN